MPPYGTTAAGFGLAWQRLGIGGSGFGRLSLRLAAAVIVGAVLTVSACVLTFVVPLFTDRPTADKLGVTATTTNARGFYSLTVYYGDDMLKTRSKSTLIETTVCYDNERVDMHWGNLVASAGWHYVFSPVIFGEFNAAYTRYASALKHDWYDDYRENGEIMSFTRDINRSDNNISGWIDPDGYQHKAYRAEHRALAGFTLRLGFDF